MTKTEKQILMQALEEAREKFNDVITEHHGAPTYYELDLDVYKLDEADMKPYEKMSLQANWKTRAEVENVESINNQKQ